MCYIYNRVQRTLNRGQGVRIMHYKLYMHNLYMLHTRLNACLEGWEMLTATTSAPFSLDIDVWCDKQVGQNNQSEQDILTRMHVGVVVLIDLSCFGWDVEGCHSCWYRKVR